MAGGAMPMGYGDQVAGDDHEAARALPRAASWRHVKGRSAGIRALARMRQAQTRSSTPRLLRSGVKATPPSSNTRLSVARTVSDGVA